MYFTIGQFQKVMDPELEGLRQARMQQLQGGGEQAAQKVKYSEILLDFFITVRLSSHNFQRSLPWFGAARCWDFLQ